MLHGSYAEATLTIFLPFCREDQVRKRVIQINWPCLFNNIRRSAPWRNIEKQLDLPAAFVKLSDGKRGLSEIVGEEYQPFVGFRVVELDASQRTVEALT